MNIILTNKDKVFLELKDKENNIKGVKRRFSNFSQTNKLKKKYNLFPSNNKKLNKSISKLTIKKKKLENNNDNTLNEYLHSHKFGIQRQNTKRKTVKNNKEININLNNNKSMYNKNFHDWKSMIYYPIKKKIPKKNEILKKKEETNLKIIENSLMIKLNSMRYYMQNEPNINDSFDNYFDNKILNISNNNSNQSSSQNIKKYINNSIQSLSLYNINKNKVKKTFKRNSHSLFYIHKKNSINNNLDNNNHRRISGFGNNKNKPKREFKSEIINNSLNKQYLVKFIIIKLIVN